MIQINTENNKKEIKDHGDYAFPVNISVERIENYEQGVFLWHWHPEIELTLILSGEMEYHVNQETYHMREGEVLFGNSRTLHAGYRIGREKCTYLSITFHPRFLYGYEGSILQTKYVNFITENADRGSLKITEKVNEEIEKARMKGGNIKENSIMEESTTEGSIEENIKESVEEIEKDSACEIMSYMKKIYVLSRQKPEDYELQVHENLMKIWGNLYRYYSGKPEQKKKYGRQFERIREMFDYIEEHYQEEIRLEDIARSVNLCKNECCRFFKKHTNMTIMEYVLFYRINKSLPLLQAGQTITQTAGMVGFSNAAYYGQIFKRYMGCTPKKYQMDSSGMRV